jgi:alkylation response protein AidB-like acyl-CoA dehydrogenase
MGRVIAPEPFVEVVVLAGGLVEAAGTDEQRADVLGRVAEGQLVLAAALAEPGARWDLTGGGVTASPSGDGWTLSGVKEPVLHGARADALVVSAATDAGTGLFLVEGDATGLTRSGYRTFEGGRAAHVAFDGTPATPLGDVATDQSALVDDVVARAQVAYCHEAIGAMDTALKLTVEYLKTRKQFGVTLSTFQALTFRAADLYVSLELVRSTVAWATLVLLDEPDRAREAAARAKLQVSTAGRHIGEEAIQLHGGIGMTAEYSVGHYMSRLTAIDHWLGDGAEHLRVLANSLEDHTVLNPLP